MKIKRIICVLLALLTLCGVFVSCSSLNDDEQGTRGPEVTYLDDDGKRYDENGFLMDDLPDDIEVVLQGVCMPDVPNFVMIEGLRSQYSTQEADVVLNLKNYTDPVTWYVNDKPLGGNIFSPSALAPGRYKISFKNDDIRGEVRVTIIE